MNRLHHLVGREFDVPATISNLGPGFDAMSVAVQLYLRVRMVDVTPGRPGTIEWEFPDGPPPGDNRIEAAFLAAQTAFGAAPCGLRVEVRSDIPPRAGLGSSAAAAVAGLRVYEAVTSSQPPGAWLPVACRLEGHPDNAAAALLGGLAVSCQHDDGRVTARTCRWPEHIRIVVATPHAGVPTTLARSVLPREIPLRDGVFNLQHALLLLHAVHSGTADDFRDALRDRWHQKQRAAVIPGLTEALALEHPSLLGVCLSGAGPSVVAFTTAQEQDVVELLQHLYDSLHVPCTVRTLAPHQPVDAASLANVTS